MTRDYVAEFLAKGGTIKTAPAGVSLDAGATSRAAEHRAERRAEMAHDFFFVGDRDAGYAAMRGDFD